MSIKKLLLSALLLTTTGFVYAQTTTTDYIQIEDCTGDKAIVAGVNDREKGIININLINPSGDWCAFQFDLELPKGVEIGTYTYKNKELPDYHPTGRLEIAPNTYFSHDMAKQSDGSYRFIAYNNQNDPVWQEDEHDLAIFTIRLIATDEANTGTFTGKIKNAILSNSYDGDQGTEVTGANCEEKEAKFTIQINAKVGAAGYGTFSWPRAVDFSDVAGVKVYIAKEAAKNGWVHLDELTNKIVPVGTGVIIKGSEGLVNPKTIYSSKDEDLEKLSAIPENQLTGTHADTKGKTVGSSDNIFALATKNGKTAFYPVSTGFVIPQYKAYMTNSDADGAKFISFGDTATSIDALDVADDEGDIYTLGGQKVQKTTMKGVYIKNGKKVVVK